jgi:cyanate lyase
MTLVAKTSQQQNAMNKTEMTPAILAAKKKYKLTWASIAQSAGASPVFITSACLGMNSLQPEVASRLCRLLKLPAAVADALQECPHKHWDKLVPTDPVLYRFYEMINVYGPTLKELIHEEFGDGIMSAIDFDMVVSRVKNEKGDRVRIEMTGKFLPYKAW